MGKHPDQALSATYVRNVKEPGFHSDGNCLYLVVEESGSKHWIVRVTIHKKRHDVGIGSLKYISLAEARDKAVEIRKLARAGGDPLAERRQEKQAAERERSMPDFETAARAVYLEREPTFTNDDHKRQWIGQIEKHVIPVIGRRRIDTITSDDLLRVLSPIWLSSHEIAKRIKQRIEVIINWAKAKGYYIGDNPVEGLGEVLPKPNRQDKHYDALAYGAVPDFMTALRSSGSGISGLAFELLILTASRTTEILRARWNEVDLDNAVWLRPADHMKMKRPHRVPLSVRAIEVLREAKRITDGSDYVFPGPRSGSGLGVMSMHLVLRRMGQSGFTPHGFRSSFRDWAEERMHYNRHAIEMCLAHAVRGTEGDYLRSDMFEARRTIMDDWARFCTAAPAAKVVKMRG